MGEEWEGGGRLGGRVGEVGERGGENVLWVGPERASGFNVGVGWGGRVSILIFPFPSD